MKDSPFHEDDLSSHRFVDAALREHHRLGGAERDEDLVRTILRETVDRVEPVAALSERRRQDQKLWIMGVASAAAIVAALATLLAVLPFRSGSRDIEEIRFVVQYAPEAAPLDLFSEPPPHKDSAPLSAPVAFAIDLSPVESSLAPPSSVEDIHPSFSPSFSEVPKPAMAEHRLRIESNETERSDDRRIYRGDVVVRHDRFRLDSDFVELITSIGSENEEEMKLFSSRALLEQVSPMRKVLAESITYEPALDRFTLQGVVFLETGQGRLDSFAPEDLVILTSETFIVRKAPQAP